MSYLTDVKALLPHARAIVIEHQRGSISLVQRDLKIGYNAASELLDMLEAEGIVGPLGSDGDFVRPVLVPRGQNPRMALSNKEKQEAYRQRRAEEGLQEVRGIFLPPELHAELKEYARKLAKKRQTDQRRLPKP